MTKDRFSRRSDSEGDGDRRRVPAAAHAERSPAATASGFPTRFISITWTNGTVPPNFFPSGSAGPLPATLPPILQPLAAWSSKLLVRCARRRPRPAPSTSTSCWTTTRSTAATRSYPSLLTGFDQRRSGRRWTRLIANYLAPSAGVTNAQLNVGCRPEGSSTSLACRRIRRTASRPIRTSSSTACLPGRAMPASQVNALFVRRKSVLDFVSGELTNFASNLGTRRQDHRPEPHGLDPAARDAAAVDA